MKRVWATKDFFLPLRSSSHYRLETRNYTQGRRAGVGRSRPLQPLITPKECGGWYDRDSNRFSTVGVDFGTYLIQKKSIFYLFWTLRTHRNGFPSGTKILSRQKPGHPGILVVSFLLKSSRGGERRGFRLRLTRSLLSSFGKDPPVLQAEGPVTPSTTEEGPNSLLSTTPSSHPASTRHAPIF